MFILRWTGERYEATGNTYPHKDDLKDAGFQWDNDKKVWHTTNEFAAGRMIGYANFGARDHYEANQQKRQRLFELSSALTSDLKVPAPEGQKLYPFQCAAVEYALLAGSCIIGDDMGLGKSAESLGVVNVKPNIRTVLIVCKARLKIQWKEQCELWIIHPDIDIHIADSSPIPPPNPERLQIVIVNFEILTNSDCRTQEGRKATRAAKASGKKPRVKLRPDLNRMFDVVIVDECQHLKNPKALRTKAANQLKGDCFLYLSGTVAEHPLELWPTLQKLDNSTWNNWKRYVFRYCGAYEDRWGIKFGDPENKDELQSILRSSYFIRRTKEQALPFLPAKRRQIVVIPAQPGAVSAEQSKLFKDNSVKSLIDQLTLLEFSDDLATYEAQIKRLKSQFKAEFEQMTRARHETAMAKLPMLIEHTGEAIESGSKITFMGFHRDLLEEIHSAFSKQSVLFYGEMSTRDTDRAVYRFNNDDKVRLFTGSYIAAGEGITIVVSNHMIFGEIDWSVKVMKQAEDRIYRIGQHWPVLIQPVVMENSIDVKIASILVKKMGLVEDILDKGAKAI